MKSVKIPSTIEGAFVLENKKGQIVRVLDWQGTSLHIVYRHDTRRIETWESLEILKSEKIAYDLIKTVKKSEVKKSDIKIENIGALKFTHNFGFHTPAVKHTEDDPKPFFISLKYLSAGSAGLLVALFLISFFFKPSEEIELKTVEIIERQKPQEKQREERVKIRQTPKVVKASNKKQLTPKISRSVTPRKATKVTTKEMTLNQMGALGALGSLNKSNQRGGLNLDNVQTSKGIGRGGSQGSGGMQTSLYGKGLVSAPLGEGQRADGAGGYGTKGKGGGQAGYGRISLVGSGGSFFQPVRSETLVEGGLDKNEIAAVIERHLGEIRYCYEQGLQQDPDMSGRVSMGFSIGADGYVKTANITNSSLRSKQVEGCITNRLKSWKFPKPRGGVIVKVNYPFVLKRVSDS